MKELSLSLGGGRSTSLTVYGRGSEPLLLAHGAGTNQRHHSTVNLAEALGARGFGVITFDYPYARAGRRLPDRMPVLMECHRASIAWVESEFGSAPVLAGRSMGGRVATMVAAEGVTAPAVVAYGYPLHPAGKPDRLRVEHLASISVPMVFFRGERDALSLPHLFDAHVRTLVQAKVVDIPGENHSLAKPGTAELMAEKTRCFFDALDGFGATGPLRP